MDLPVGILLRYPRHFDNHEVDAEKNMREGVESCKELLKIH